MELESVEGRPQTTPAEPRCPVPPTGLDPTALQSGLASVLSRELQLRLEHLRVQIRNDLCNELQELRKDMHEIRPKTASALRNSGSSSSNRASSEPQLAAAAGNGIQGTSLPSLPTKTKQSEIVLADALAPGGRPVEPRCPSPPPEPDPEGGRPQIAKESTNSAQNGNGLSKAGDNDSAVTYGYGDGKSLPEASRSDHDGACERDAVASPPHPEGTQSTCTRTPSRRVSQATREAHAEIDRAYRVEHSVSFVQKPRLNRAWTKHNVASNIAERIPIVHPGGRVTKIWCPSIYVAVICVVTCAPFEAAFYWWEPPVIYKVATVFLDIVFLADMCMYFNTAYYQRGILITDRKLIAKRYMKSYFFLDVVANFPYDWFLGPGSATSRKFTKLGKLPKVLRFFRMLAAFKDHVEYVGVSAAICTVLLVSHYVTCVWAASLTGDCEANGTCPDVFGSYFQAFRISLSGFLATETFSSHFVPSGDGHTALLAEASLRDLGQPLKTREDFLAVGVNICGFMAVAFLFANVASAVRLRSELSIQRKRLLDRRSEEMLIANVPDHLRRKVVRCYQYIWGDPCAYFADYPNGLLRDRHLSLWVKRELAYHVYGDWLKQVKIFQEIPEHFLKCLSQLVEVRHYIPGDFIVLFGEVGRELYIMTEGIARPLTQDEEWLGDTAFKPGDVFGELCFLNPGSRRSASVVCLHYTRVLVVMLEHFHDLSLGPFLGKVRRSAAELLEKMGSEDRANLNEDGKDTLRQYRTGDMTFEPKLSFGDRPLMIS